MSLASIFLIVIIVFFIVFFVLVLRWYTEIKNNLKKAERSAKSMAIVLNEILAHKKNKDKSV